MSPGLPPLGPQGGPTREPLQPLSVGISDAVTAICSLLAPTHAHWGLETHRRSSIPYSTFPEKARLPSVGFQIPSANFLLPITEPPVALFLGLGELPSSLSRARAISKDKENSGLSTGLCPPTPSGTTKATCWSGNRMSPASEGAQLRSITHARPLVWRLFLERAVVGLGGHLSTFHPSAVVQVGTYKWLCRGAGEGWRDSGGGGFSDQRLHESAGT